MQAATTRGLAHTAGPTHKHRCPMVPCGCAGPGTGARRRPVRRHVRRRRARWAGAIGEAAVLFAVSSPACRASGSLSRHVELVPALAPPRLRVVLRGDQHARRHGDVHRVAGAAAAALGRAPRRVRPRTTRQQPPASVNQLLSHQLVTGMGSCCVCCHPPEI
uniref:Uncharacterized protein n=1 Tax=Arundo donax TaxID=35708 RepID=A0A0A9EXC6_ARUDO